MKKTLLLIAALVLMTSPAWAVITQSFPFLVSASIPAATGSAVTLSEVTKVGSTITFTPLTGTAMNFNTSGFLPFNLANKIYIPDRFFALDVAGSGGAGNPDVTVTYSGETKPAGQINGLGAKATATFVKVAGATGSQTETVLANGKKRLIDLSGESILKTAYAGGFLRVYVGVVTKDPAAVPADPATSEPFTNADLPGAYSGTLTISTTVP